MSTIRPFEALRPARDKAASIACAPYDVVYESEAREQIARNPETFLRVTRPEADMPPGVDANSQEAFEKGRENLREFMDQGLLSIDDEEAIYVYQLAAGEQVQTGVVACCSIDEYEQGTIKRHEKTRPDKVADRTGHMVTVGAQTGLVFLAFRGTDRTRELISQTIEGEPLYDFVADGVRQRVWRSTNTASWVNAFQQVPAIYIADGHHRVESARLAREQLRERNPAHTGDEAYNYVIAGIFPAEDLKILPYNRVVKDLNGLSREQFLDRLGASFAVKGSGGVKVPDNRGEMCMYVDGEWYHLRFTGDRDGLDAIGGLDVSILHDNILAPILGIGDVRTDPRIAFVGGKRGTEELEKMVDENGGVAFSMFATTMDDLLAVSDAGEIMPPKSTWFEPKLKDGLLVHMIDNG